jgi:ribosomal protein S18 acetylase RimI-like enzyme
VNDALLARVEHAGLNASASPRQHGLDGWLLRFSPGKAKRARCINALAAGQRAVDDKLRECAVLYREAGLPLIVRSTPFSQPAGLDDLLAQRGWQRFDDTLVMVLVGLDRVAEAALPSGIVVAPAAASEYARAVGALRGSTPGEVAAQAERVAASPVPYEGVLWRREGEVVACGQMAREGDLVGLYDVFTAPAERGRGLARALCAQLLVQARNQGARVGYLQVDAVNEPAQAVYRRLGFNEGYQYHYRSAEAGAH